jgi:hypothetical protein
MRKKTFLWLIPLLAIVLLIVFFPALASTPIGKPVVVSALESRLKAKVSIEALRLSWFGPQVFEKISFSNPEVAGTVGEVRSAVPLWSLSELSDSFQLKNGEFSFPGYGGGKLTQVNAQIEGSEVSAAGSTNLGGQLSLKGKIYSKEDFDIVVYLKSAPTGALDQVLQMNGLLYQALGPTLDLNATAVYNRGEGTLSVDLSSTNAQTSFQASLSENALTLKESATATLRLTPGLSEALMRDVNPLFLTSLESKTPVVLRVSPKNFSYPVPFSLDRLKVGSAMLDMGRVRARTGKSLQSLLSLLKSPKTGGEINMWFTPVSFSVDNGVLSTGRMDALLADSIHICTWGDVDLLRDNLNMYLGLPAETIQNAFGIQNLPRNYVLKIPIRGSTKDPEIDTSAASSKIASMAAAQQIPKIGGTPGKIFGGFLDLITQPKEDEDVPPPNRPFPWER